MKFSWNRINRKVHYWGALICALPILIVIITGIFLLLKKESAWIQPPTMKGQGNTPTLTFPEILTAAQKSPELQVTTWDDIDRLDVRPSKGVIKIRAKNRWELQVDQQTGQSLHVAYRRSEIIESLHDGSWFHDTVKLWIFLPCAIILLTLWLTGIYLFVIPLLAKQKRRKKKKARVA